jgi:hypothetical protein
MLDEDRRPVELNTPKADHEGTKEIMNPLFEARILTYLKLTGKRLGLLININVPLIVNGIKRPIF